MLLQIQLPTHDDAIAFHREHWSAVLEDTRFADVPEKIETNGWGQIVMSPPPDSEHCRIRFKIAKQLDRILGGEAFTQCPILTADSVRAIDAAWHSSKRFQAVRGQRAFETAPEICVEVVSPCNTAAEMTVKRQLYFDAGASECWTCDMTGQMTYYYHNSPDEPESQSILCPTFPNPLLD